MSGRTPNYGFTWLAPGENLSVDDYRFIYDNPQMLDLLVRMLGEDHHHTGLARLVTSMPAAPTLTLHTDAGTLPAGVNAYYRYALVDPDGFEAAASAEAVIATQAVIATPGAPTLSTVATGGALPPGQYLYAVSAYQGAITSETLESAMVIVTVPVGTSTNVITLTMPDLPAGATGFNIFRQKPGAAGFFYLASTTGSSYDDNGSVLEDCTRLLPQRNTTSSTNRVVVTLPGATPALPAGWTWRLYRTLSANDYRKSLLHHVTEQTVPGVVDVSYEDLGGATTVGKPQNQAVIPGTPQKVLLTGGAEVRGLLPADMIDGGIMPNVEAWAARTPPAVALLSTNAQYPDEMAVAAIGTTVYMSGGFFPGSGGTEIVNDLWAYDTVADTWTQLADMPDTRENHAMVAFGGKLYVFGGDNDSLDNSTTTWEYTPGTNTWAVKAVMPNPRDFVRAVATATRIVLIGGYDDTGDVAEIDAYTVASNTWATVGSHIAEESALAYWPGDADVVAGFFVFGGYEPQATGFPRVLSSLYFIDEATFTPHILPIFSTTAPNLAGSQLVIRDGRVWFFGGDALTGMGSGRTVGSISVHVAKTVAGNYTNPDQEQWRPEQPFADERTNGGVADVGGVFYFVGGSQETDRFIVALEQTQGQRLADLLDFPAGSANRFDALVVTPFGLQRVQLPEPLGWEHEGAWRDATQYTPGDGGNDFEENRTVTYRGGLYKYRYNGASNTGWSDVPGVTSDPTNKWTELVPPPSPRDLAASRIYAAQNFR